MEIQNVVNKENALFAAKMAVGVVAAGAILAGTGHIIHLAGVELLKHANGDAVAHIAARTIGSWMEYGGNGLFLAGKYTAYTVLVPAYIIGYEFPKWVIEKGIPMGTELFNRYVIQPAIKHVVQLGETVARAWSYVLDEYLIPIACKVEQFVSRYIIVPLQQSIDWLAKKAICLWNDYLVPALTKIATLVKDYLAQPILEGIEWLAKKTICLWNDCLVPALTKIGQLARDYIAVPCTNALRWLGDRVVDIIQMSYNYLLNPLYQGLSKVVIFAKEYLIQPILKGIEWLGERLADGLKVASDYLLIPFIKVANQIKQMIYQNVWVPLAQVATWMSNRIVEILQFSNDYLLQPLMNTALAIIQVVKSVVESVAILATQIGSSISSAVNAFYEQTRRDIGALLGYN